ncbi:extracellular solute-binding protein [Paenibacillus hemerocallicola]|uniref:Extracellular solute-binding protein n=1 Tax=Paenibacillus hemerocallicola TaxID=1172614 RepID=A0A5C4SYC9_9BACL|nr:extracellular solute-binding protein [Paenibacillus hemerocallicola]TNJ61608.1 extracellular solute-binding protein [Paenibacillus hemerocallicola]
MQLVHKTKWLAAIACLSGIATACGSGGDSSSAPPQPQQPKVDLSAPAELSIFTTITSQQKAFEEAIAKLKTKYPQYTIKLLLPTKEITLDSLIASGVIPDIVWDSASGMKTSLIDKGLQYDMTELIKTYKVDLERFDPSTIQMMREASGQGRMYGLPDDVNGTVLFYNKDIFDRFGVKYPKDGLSWEEAYDLAKTLTRTENNINYKGLGMFYSFLMSSNQLSLPLIDPKEDKASVNTDSWKRLFNTYKQFYEIPGNQLDSKFNNFNGQLNAFYQDQNVAMVISPLSGSGRFAQAQNLKWDMAAAPTFKDASKTGFQAGPRYFFVTNGKNKEQAFQVVTHLLTDEVQLQNNKEGRATSLKDDKIRQTFGQEGEQFKGKHVAAVFYNQFAVSPVPNPISSLVSLGDINTEFLNVIEGKKDVNTALRDADEAINKKIAEAKAK